MDTQEITFRKLVFYFTQLKFGKNTSPVRSNFHIVPQALYKKNFVEKYLYFFLSDIKKQIRSFGHTRRGVFHDNSLLNLV